MEQLRNTYKDSLSNEQRDKLKAWREEKGYAQGDQGGHASETYRDSLNNEGKDEH